jgi:hypothetical protein
MLRGIQVSKIAVEESVCQWCGARIYLVRVSINNWEWVTDLKRPHAWNRQRHVCISRSSYASAITSSGCDDQDPGSSMRIIAGPF